MKSLFRFLLFGSLIFLAGCTITKRRYTGGYNVNWHTGKSSDARVLSHQAQTKYDGYNSQRAPFGKIANPIIAPNITSIAARTPKANIAEKEQIIYRDKATIKITPIYKLIPPSFSYPYSIVPSDTIANSTPQKDTSKRDVRIAWLFCLFGILSQVAFFAALILPINIELAYVFIVSFPLSLVFFIISLVYSFKVMKYGLNKGLTIIVVLDIICIILMGIYTFLFFTVFY